jgi:hypothetical protein
MPPPSPPLNRELAPALAVFPETRLSETVSVPAL